MAFLQNFLENLDVDGLVTLLVRVVAALVCIILHECAHGFVADRLGDHTARRRGRLSWNPIRHIDPLGLVVMVIAGVGWAKPVPVDMRNFKHPKRGMALTALAGPVSNFLLAIVGLFFAGLVLKIPMYYSSPRWQIYLWYYGFLLLARIGVMSVGLGLFNLIPIPPLDGSKILFSFFPDKVYYTILKYERYVMLVLFVAVFFGVLDVPLSWAINHVLYWLCLLTGFPPTMFGL